jgi:hypothetical protein
MKKEGMYLLEERSVGLCYWKEIHARKTIIDVKERSCSKV